MTVFDINITDCVGTWLSLVEHSVRDAGVAGSNPVVPTKNIYYNYSCLSSIEFWNCAHYIANFV